MSHTYTYVYSVTWTTFTYQRRRGRILKKIQNLAYLSATLVHPNSISSTIQSSRRLIVSVTSSFREKEAYLIDENVHLARKKIYEESSEDEIITSINQDPATIDNVPAQSTGKRT